MSKFSNSPNLKSANAPDGMVKRWVHQPIRIDYFGITAQITANGKVIIRSAGIPTGDMIEYDEVQVPAGLVFKLASLLKDTRSIQYVPVSEAQNHPQTDEVM